MPTAGAEFQLTSLSIDVGGYKISQITGSRSRGVYHALENFRGRKKKNERPSLSVNSLGSRQDGKHAINRKSLERLSYILE